ncbi:MAG: cytochrome c oxidase subunit 3 [Rhodospirillaceae bacterium]
MSDASAGTRNHPFHIIDPSPWPAVGALAAFVLTVGAVFYMHGDGAWLMLLGVAMVLFVMVGWWRDVIHESRVEKAHTPKVITGLQWGMILFIVSEVMFFAAFFWAYFHNALLINPSMTLEGLPDADLVQFAEDRIPAMWPPEGLETVPAFGLPFINTVILLTSGFVLMWGMKGLKKENWKQLQRGILGAVVLGFLFLGLQIYEYYIIAYDYWVITDGAFPSTFYLATGFHGFHVFVGACFLTVCYFRARKQGFTKEKHIGLLSAEWYWHFVDVVWLFLFVWVYWWVGLAPAV